MKDRLFLVLLTAGLASCFNPDRYVNPDTSGFIHFLSADTTVIGDGVSQAKINVQISDQADRSFQKIVFKTNFGKFINGTGDSIVVEMNSTFVAIAKLTSIDTGTAMVTAKIRGIKTSTPFKLQFARAYPQSLDVTVDSFELSSGFSNHLKITGTAKTSNGGIASTGQKIRFKVLDSFGNSVGYFLNDKSTSITDSMGSGTVQFSAGDVAFNGFLTIIGTTAADAKNGLITGQIKIHLKP